MRRPSLQSPSSDIFSPQALEAPLLPTATVSNLT